MQIITDSKIIQWQNIIYIEKTEIKSLDYFLYLYSWETVKSSLPHERLPTNQIMLRKKILIGDCMGKR
jgi:hypothetical protein